MAITTKLETIAPVQSTQNIFQGLIDTVYPFDPQPFDPWNPVNPDTPFTGTLYVYWTDVTPMYTDGSAHIVTLHYGLKNDYDGNGVTATIAASNTWATVGIVNKTNKTVTIILLENTLITRNVWISLAAADKDDNLIQRFLLYQNVKEVSDYVNISNGYSHTVSYNAQYVNLMIDTNFTYYNYEIVTGTGTSSMIDRNASVLNNNVLSIKVNQFTGATTRQLSFKIKLTEKNADGVVYENNTVESDSITIKQNSKPGLSIEVDPESLLFNTGVGTSKQVTIITNNDAEVGYGTSTTGLLTYLSIQRLATTAIPGDTDKVKHIYEVRQIRDYSGSGINGVVTISATLPGETQTKQVAISLQKVPNAVLISDYTYNDKAAIHLDWYGRPYKDAAKIQYNAPSFRNIIITTRTGNTDYVTNNLSTATQGFITWTGTGNLSSNPDDFTVYLYTAIITTSNGVEPLEFYVVLDKSPQLITGPIWKDTYIDCGDYNYFRLKYVLTNEIIYTGKIYSDLNSMVNISAILRQYFNINTYPFTSWINALNVYQDFIIDYSNDRLFPEFEQGQLCRMFWDYSYDYEYQNLGGGLSLNSNPNYDFWNPIDYYDYRQMVIIPIVRPLNNSLYNTLTINGVNLDTDTDDVLLSYGDPTWDRNVSLYDDIYNLCLRPGMDYEYIEYRTLKYSGTVLQNLDDTDDYPVVFDPDTDIDDPADAPVKPPRRLTGKIATCRCTNARYCVYYINTKGMWCWMLFEGKTQVTRKATPTDFRRRPNTGNISYHENIKYNIGYVDTYSLTTNYLSDRASEKLKDLLVSPIVYIMDLDSNTLQLQAVNVEQNQYVEKTYKNNGRKMFTQTYTFTHAINKNIIL